ncbi:MAG: hypothetical protein Q9181_001974 [Wetmoreana brouardii]
MADPFSTVAAVVSFADVTIRACKGVNEVVGTWKDTPNAIKHLRQTVQRLESMLGSLRLYVVEYESSKLFLQQHQLLPDIIKNELPEIDLEVKFLQAWLSPAGTRGKIGQRLRRMIDEKKILEVVNRLERRQVAIMTALQILEQKNMIQLHEQVSSLHNDLRQIDATTSSQLEGAKSSINRQLHDIARNGSDSFAAQNTILDSIHTLTEPILNNNAMIIDKLDHLGHLLTTREQNEGHLLTNTILQATSVNTILRIVRAELKRVIIPISEAYLNPYNSSHITQLNGIRRNLDQIASALGRSSMDELAAKMNKDNQTSTTGLQDPKLRGDVSDQQGPLTKTIDQLPGFVRRANSSDNHVVQPWSHSWSRTWIFHWRIGVLIVHITASHRQSPVRQQEFQAFEHCRAPFTRHSYLVSIDFWPAPSLFIARGISIQCKSQQDQRGFYGMCPRLVTFAIVPDDAEVFNCVRNRDLAGLKMLFEAGIAAPTDRTAILDTLPHAACCRGFDDICEFLLVEGADPLATNRYGHDCLLAAQIGCSLAQRRTMSETVDYYSVIRVLLRYGCELEWVLRLLMDYPTDFCSPWLTNFEKELDFKEEELDSEENPESEGELGFEERFVRRELLTLENRLDFENHLSQRYKAILKRPPNTLLDWVSFLSNQGLDVNDTNEKGYTLLMRQIVEIVLPSDRPPPTRSDVIKVLVLCLLKADVSIREPTLGLQALHLLLLGKTTGLHTSLFSDLAYVLIRYGGADVSATTYDGQSLLEAAYHIGWLDEWITVLHRCGISIEEVFTKERQRPNRSWYLGNGDSTAVDTEDLLQDCSNIVTKRKPILGDRLVDGI